MPGTKVARIKLLKPLSPVSDWNDFRPILKQLQGEVRTASNRCMTACNLAYADIACGADRKSTLDGVRKQMYEIGKQNAVNLQTGNAGTIGNEIYKRYFTGKNSYESMMKKGTGNPPMSFGKKMPIPIKDMAKACKINMDSSGKTDITIPLTSKPFKKEWNLKHQENPIKNGMFSFAADTSSNSIRCILERCMTGEYKMCGSKLVEGDKGLYLHLVYKFDVPKQKELDPKRVCGVDLGIKYAAVCAIPDLPERKCFINGEKVITHCIKLEKLRKRQQRLAKYDTHDGHGRNPKTTFSKPVRHKQANYRMTVNRKYAKTIVDFARKNGCGEIRMEDLSGFNARHKDNKFLGKWTYYQLQDFVDQKAKQFDISVVKVKPKDTSRRCSVCGHIDPDNRLTQADFICTKCGYKTNADYNAAINIAGWAEKSK